MRTFQAAREFDREMPTPLARNPQRRLPPLCSNSTQTFLAWACFITLVNASRAAP